MELNVYLFSQIIMSHFCGTREAVNNEVQNEEIAGNGAYYFLIKM